MSEYRLHKWSVVNSNPWAAPEVGGQQLQGYRDSETDHRVITSPIVKAEGKMITTQSGSVYHLQDPNPEYLQWLKDNEIDFDPENPIKIKKVY